MFPHYIKIDKIIDKIIVKIIVEIIVKKIDKIRIDKARDQNLYPSPLGTLLFKM